MSSSLEDLIINTNNVVNTNLSKLNNKISLIKIGLDQNNENELNELYYRISINFNSLIVKIHSKLFEIIDKYESIIKQNEKDILQLMMDKMLLQIENNHLKEIRIFNFNNKNNKCQQKKLNIKTSHSKEINNIYLEKLSKLNEHKFNNSADIRHNKFLTKSSSNLNNLDSNKSLKKYKKIQKFKTKTKRIKKFFDCSKTLFNDNIDKKKVERSYLNINNIKDEMNSIINKNNRQISISSNNKVTNNTSVNIYNTTNSQYSINNYDYKKNHIIFIKRKNESNKNNIRINKQPQNYLLMNLKMKKPAYNNIKLKNETNKNNIQSMDNIKSVLNDKIKLKTNYNDIKNLNNNELSFYDKINKSQVNVSRNYKSKEHNNNNLYYNTELYKIEAEYGDQNKEKEKSNINNKKIKENVKLFTRKKKFVSLNIKSLKYPNLFDKIKVKNNNRNEDNIESYPSQNN